MKTTALTVGMALLAAPLAAEGHASGDAANGETIFARQCVACHVVVNDAGETLAGRNSMTGPNLYAVAGRTIGSVEDFDYSDALLALNEQEAVWDEANFVAYTQDPTGWLRETLDDRRARGAMAFQLRSEEDAADVYAYLASLAPAAEDAEMEGDDSGDS